MSKVQILIATMNQSSHELLERMNIQSDAIVGNQTDFNKVEEFDYNGNKIKWLSFNERGVGLNRNNALMRADGDICMLADDDVVFYDGYAEVIFEVFEENKTADVIIFNIEENPIVRHVNKKKIRINKRNYGKYGAVRIAFRRESIFLHGISFNLSFGGGTKYAAGEDVLFLKSCLDASLNVIAVPVTVAKLVNDRESTWFSGYNEKYFFDKGVFFYVANKKFANLCCMYNAVKHRKRYKEYGVVNAYKMMIKGVKSCKNR